MNCMKQNTDNSQIYTMQDYLKIITVKISDRLLADRLNLWVTFSPHSPTTTPSPPFLCCNKCKLGNEL